MERNSFCQHLQIKLKLHLLLFYPSTWHICDFFLLHIEIERKGGWIIGGGGGGGGGKGYVAPPPPSSYEYVMRSIIHVPA